MSAPKRVLLAWEGGAGRGHVVTLKVIAEALGDDLAYDAALCRMDHAAEIEPLCDRVFRGAWLWVNLARRQTAGRPRTSTWAEFLGDLNFGDPDFLVTQIDWWLKTIRARRSDMLVGDFAPCAILAARIAGIPAVAVGTGYSVPPPGIDNFPVLIPGFTDRIYAEADLLAAANTALARFGAAPLARLADINAGVTLLPRTIEALDPYYGLRHDPVLLPPLNEALPRPDGTGDEVFAYFSTAETDDPALVEALATLDLPVRAFLPGADAEIAGRLAASGVIVETRPVPVEDIGRRTRVFLNAGQHGSLCMGLGMGLVQVAFPQHLEHLCHASRAAAVGAVEVVEKNRHDADGIRDLIAARYADVGARTRARETATMLYPQLFGDVRGLIRRRLRPLLGLAA